MNILYRTKLYTPPIGKPRVFLVCHKDDFLNYSDVIFEDLFNESNCVVYYADPFEEYDVNELLDDLSQMQLFVFAVTKRLLLADEILDPVLDYARHNSIPMLPLVQEKINIELYQEKFGDIQFLDKNATTETSISYNERLNKYLTAVLVTDEVAQNVRSDFDAYIFMSYRKKDRQYANKLMHIIHSHDLFRDVAIWYDEFLIPGENFNNAIMEMIDKSDLFVLNVTPNLVLESNYVMAVEYPTALKLDKKMVAFEMMGTNPSQLKKCFPSFPGCINPDSPKAVEAALQEAFKDIPLRTKDSPEHLLHMGCAYLWGIDMEVDHTKAKDLIIQAALSGNLDAISLLAMMYAKGFGVDMDYNKAIEMYEKYIDVVEKVGTWSNEIQSIGKYSDSLLDLSELYKMTKDYESEKKTLDKLLNVCDDYLPNLSNTLKMKVRMMLGENADNRKDYLEAKQIFSDIVEDSKQLMDTDQGNLFVRSSSMLGDLYQKYGDIDLAEQCFLEADKVKKLFAYELKPKVNEYLEDVQKDITRIREEGLYIKDHFTKNEE